MTGKTHVAIGIAAGLILSKGEPEKTKTIFILASAFGSLVPDLDHPKAKLNQRLLLFKNKFFRTLFYLSATFLFAYLYYTQENLIFIPLGIMALLISVSTHRGFTHSILGYLLASSIIKMLSLNYNLPAIYSGFSIGYISHIIADFFTIKGIKLFYPFGKNISSPIMIKTSNHEGVILVLLCIVIYMFIRL